MDLRPTPLRLATMAALILTGHRAWGKPKEPSADVTPSPSPTPVATSEGLGEEGRLRRAVSLYDAGQYELCVDAFVSLLDPAESTRFRSPSKIETAQIYHGACLIGVGRTLDAEAVFRQAIAENPQMKTPDSLLFPEAVVELFLRVRESMLDEIRKSELKRLKDAEARVAREQDAHAAERRRVATLAKLASEESVVEVRSRPLAFLPFGVGQFQNQQKGLGFAFLGSEAAATAVLVTSLYMTAWYGAKAQTRGLSGDAIREYSAKQQDAYLVSTVSGWTLVGLSLTGIIEANLSFVPEVKRTRQRPLKELPEGEASPQKSGRPGWSVAFVPGARDGGGLILQGQF